MSTKLSDYDFELPKELIAQTPLTDRTSSKLLVLDPKSGSIIDSKFSNLLDFVNEDDVLVMNNTRVIPARLIGAKAITGAKIEILLLDQVKPDHWECMVKPAKRIKLGDQVIFGNDDLVAECVEILDDGMRIFKMAYDGIYLEVLQKLGTMPLPPYITETLDDQERYQTVYSEVSGSAAAPTAGLHFDEGLLKALKEKNIEVLYVTLHVGLGTFKPVSADDILDHKMHEEKYQMTSDVATRLNQLKAQNKRIIAVGTTTTRVLEANFNKFGEFKADISATDIFIYPGYEFKAIDSLITNFHLPKSTLMMLISALANREMIIDSYNHAIDKEYRFFSFGDSMFINKEKRWK